MRKLATHRGTTEDKRVRFPADAVIAEETPTDVVVLEAERLTAACVPSPHLADPRQARDFQKQVIEDATEPRV
jgi:hypothetical protein